MMSAAMADSPPVSDKGRGPAAVAATPVAEATIGPLTFRLPLAFVRRLAVRRAWRRRETRVVFGGGAFGALALWFLACVPGTLPGMMVAAVMMTASVASMPFFLWYGADLRLRRLDGVANAQTWEFTATTIIVTNADGRVTSSPWSRVVASDVVDGYLLLLDAQGGFSPIPLALLEGERRMAIEARIARAGQGARSGIVLVIVVHCHVMIIVCSYALLLTRRWVAHPATVTFGVSLHLDVAHSTQEVQ
jgi:hypothetical protein